MDKKELIDLVEEVKILRLTSKDVLVIKLPEYISINIQKEVCTVFSEIFKSLDLSANHLVISGLDLDMKIVRKE